MPLRPRSRQPAKLPTVQHASLAVIGAIVALVGFGLQTSLASVSASTSSSAFFQAATVDIEQVGEPVELLFDADELFSGEVTEACVRVRYTGSVPAEVRIHGQLLGGDGLDQYLLIDLWTTDAVCPADGTGITNTGNTNTGITNTGNTNTGNTNTGKFSGTLSDIWTDHGSYADGVTLASSMTTGDEITVAARATLGDDQNAQGRTTEFVMILEARP